MSEPPPLPADGKPCGAEGPAANQTTTDHPTADSPSADHPSADHPTAAAADQADRLARRLTLTGSVQGIGYRPVLACLATDLGLAGWVANSNQGLEVHLEGDAESVTSFIDHCRSVCPPEGHLDRIAWKEVPAQHPFGFRIQELPTTSTLATRIPRDRVTCRTCQEEAADTRNRRAGYGLITCSRCGPRYSILTAMPFERFATTLHEFTLCSACGQEYRCPADRRYHAQTMGCPECGPQVSSMSAAIEALRTGGVVALKGVGGFQLLACLRHPAAIRQLRLLKHRPFKPLAIMVADLNQAADYAQLDSSAIQPLTSAAGPIVILPVASRRRTEQTEWMDELSPGLHSIGILLPTSALHAQLVAEVGPMVVTSANLEGDPIAYRDQEELPRGPDGPLPRITHNRPIQRPMDDSVVQVLGSRVATIRLARGLAPFPLELPQSCHGLSILAVGGHQKVAIALANGHQAVLGPHLGDMASLAARQRFVDHVADWLELYRCQPAVIAHDAHPDYFTTEWAREFSARTGATRVPIQHHLAHAASSVLEPQWCEEPVVALTWDGSGWGSDAMIWGGEALAYHGDSAVHICRLRPMRLPGGEAAVREPWRVAAGLLAEIGQLDDAFVNVGPPTSGLQAVLRSSIAQTRTTSVGRLFDAVAALCLRPTPSSGWQVGYEGHFAALLEAICDPSERGEYDLPVVNRPLDAGPRWQWDWEPMIRQLLADTQQHVPAGTIAMRFHRALANAVVALLDRQATRRVTLSGGVFQNQVLVKLIADRLANTHYELALPGGIPITDGGLAAGQLLVAAARMRRSCSPAPNSSA